MHLCRMTDGVQKSMLELKYPYHAGDQGSFRSDGNPKKDKTIQKYGCGLIGLADLLVYLGQSRDKAKTGEDCAAFAAPQQNAELAYRDFVLQLERTSARVHRVLGLNGLSMARGFNTYARKNNLSWKAHWGTAAKELLPSVKAMLEADIPVILSIGPNLVPWNKTPGIRFYTDPGKTGAQTPRVLDHYVTVTAVRESGQQTVLKIASWGKTWYIDFNEYQSYVKHQPPILRTIASNILIIRGTGKDQIRGTGGDQPA
jgi:hypothetical protein